ncbi:MAG: hypothetical protein LUF85_04220 [Bacteroides sp.]|nr:hypothetical protein [Bacteroides sp.]
MESSQHFLPEEKSLREASAGLAKNIRKYPFRTKKDAYGNFIRQLRTTQKDRTALSPV